MDGGRVVQVKIRAAAALVLPRAVQSQVVVQLQRVKGHVMKLIDLILNIL